MTRPVCPRCHLPTEPSLYASSLVSRCPRCGVYVRVDDGGETTSDEALAAEASAGSRPQQQISHEERRRDSSTASALLSRVQTPSDARVRQWQQWLPRLCGHATEDRNGFTLVCTRKQGHEGVHFVQSLGRRG